ncbi:MAG: hypothetical protein JNM41_13910 [Flavipsychrobacter sp.]|nr:hypothetical protein [Flavipsychrobacter sp.]
MRNTLLFLFAAIFAFSPAAAQSQQSSQSSYTIVSRVREGKYFNRKVHKETIAGLPESLKALVAYYGVIYSTNCVSDSLGQRCELTEALGLGLQGSARQTELLLKWLPNDTLIRNLKRDWNFRVMEQGSSSFDELLYLKLFVLRDTVRIDVQDLYWSQGRSESSKYSNKAVIKEGAIKFIE